MIHEGQIVLFTFPQTNQVTGKLRPALVLRPLPGSRDDWLICMISTSLHHRSYEVDEMIHESDSDFPLTGLKTSSLVRAARIAVVSAHLLHGSIGNLSEDRLNNIRMRLALWISGTSAILPIKGVTEGT